MLYKSFGWIFLWVSIFAQAQSTGIIYGEIKDESGIPLSTADIFIEGTVFSAFSDENGAYEMEVDPGTYEVIITSIGYNEVKKSLTVKEDERVEFSTILNSSEDQTTQLNQAVVVGQLNKESEVSLLNERKKSLDMKQFIGADEISKKGIGDVASAVAKTSGVARQEGLKSIFVRGLGDRYNSTTFNQLPLPSEDPGSKNIALELFATDIIKNIDIHKTFNANIYGDVAGANVDIASKELDNKGIFTISMGNGYNTNLKGNTVRVADETTYFGFPKNGSEVPIHDLQKYDFQSSFKPWARDHVFNTDFGLIAGKKFKFENNQSLSLFAVAQNNSDFQYTDGVVRNVNSNGDYKQNMTLEKSSYRATQTFLANIKYGFGSGRSIGFNSLYIHDDEQSVSDYSGFYASVSDDTSFVRRQQTNDNNLVVNQLLFDYKFSEKIAIQAAGTYNMIRSSEPDRKLNTYVLDNQSGNYVVSTNSPAINHRFFSNLEEDDWAGRFELNYKFNPDSNLVKILTLGTNYRNTERTFNATQFNFNLDSPTFIEIDNPDDLFNQDNLNNGLIEMSTGWGTNAENAFEPFSYMGERSIIAGYAQFTFPFSEKFIAMVGGRFEAVKQTVDWNTNLSSSTTDDLAVKQKGGKIEDNYILPSLSLKYAPNEDHALRLAASQTYTLPQFKETAPFLYEDVSENSFGNPYLIASSNLNFDLKYDWYLTRKELISLGGFYKSIQDPINRVRVASAANEFSYVNTEDAFVAGAEIEARKMIFSHDGERNKQDFSLGLNVSYLYSEQTLNDTDRDELTVHFSKEKDQLEGATPLLINADLTYTLEGERVEFSSAVVFNYGYDKIYSLGTDGNDRIDNNIMEKSTPVLDMVNKIKFKKSGMGLSLSAKNILNPNFDLTQDTEAGEITVKSFKKGVFLSFGINWTM